MSGRSLDGSPKLGRPLPLRSAVTHVMSSYDKDNIAKVLATASWGMSLRDLYRLMLVRYYLAFAKQSTEGSIGPALLPKCDYPGFSQFSYWSSRLYGSIRLRTKFRKTTSPRSYK